MAHKISSLDLTLTDQGIKVRTDREQDSGNVQPQPFELSSLSVDDIGTLAETFKLLGDSSRLKIMLCCIDGSSSVGEIAECLQLSPSLVSHHLRLLRGAGLVKGERVAKQVFYEVADEYVVKVMLDIISHHLIK